MFVVLYDVHCPPFGHWIYQRNRSKLPTSSHSRPSIAATGSGPAVWPCLCNNSLQIGSAFTLFTRTLTLYGFVPVASRISRSIP